MAGLRYWMVAVMVAALAAAPAARAQTPSPQAEWQLSPGIQLEKYYRDGQIPDWAVLLGGAVESKPAYPGSGRWIVDGGPVVDIRYRDLAFLSVGEGLGVNLLRGKAWRAGLSVGYDLGRAESDDRTHLNGMGDIDPAAVPKAFAEVVLFPVTVRADLRRSLGSGDGWIGDLAAYLPVAGSDAGALFVGTSASFADDRYMQTWYGVTNAQAARSVHPAYRAGGGLESVRASLTGVWFFVGDQHWLLEGDASVQRLLGSADGSPIVGETLNGVITVTVGYRF